MACRCLPISEAVGLPTVVTIKLSPLPRWRDLYFASTSSGKYARYRGSTKGRDCNRSTSDASPFRLNQLVTWVVTRMVYPVTSSTCIITLPAETSITFNCTAPISSSEIPFSLATPRRCSVQGEQPRAMAAATLIMCDVLSSSVPSVSTKLWKSENNFR